MNNMKHMGIDIGGTSIKGAVIENGAVTARAKRSTDTSCGLDSIKDCIFEVIKSLLPLIGTDAGIGIGSAGDIDPYEGKVLYATDNLPGFTGFEIKKDVESAFNRRSFVVNDAVAAFIGESYFGAAKGCKNAVMLTLGTLYMFVDRLGQPDELMPYIRPYYLVLLASLPFVMLFNAFKQFTDRITETRTSMWILLSGNVLNILGNYLLIYGKAGFPELGVVGAGVSTLFSRIYMVVMFCIVFWTRRTFAAYREGFAGLGWSRSVVRRLVAIGSPIALEMGMETAAFSLTVIMVGWIGTIALASHQVMTTISQFTFMVYYGLGAAVAVRVSYFHGQSDHQGTRQTVIAGLHLMVALELLLGGIIFLLRYDIGSWFTDSAAVTSGVVSLMLPFFIYQFGDGLQITYANALRGIADVKPLVVIAFIAFFVISLPLSYVFAFPLGYGLVGVWMAFPFGLTTAGVMMWWRFRSQMKALDKSPKA